MQHLLSAFEHLVTEYEYDALGRRIRKRVPGGGACPPPNRITTRMVDTNGSDPGGVTNTAFEHDAAGNLIHDGKFRYLFDAFGRLTRVTCAADSAFVAEYEYDALDRHAPRTTFGPWLSLYAVDPRAQVMSTRHAPAGITPKHFRVFGLFDLWREIAKLPLIRFVHGVETARAIGRCDVRPVVPVDRQRGTCGWARPLPYGRGSESRIADKQIQV